jgi:hypothetical protein
MPTSVLTVIVLLNGVPVDFGPVPQELKPSLKDGVVVVPVCLVLEGIGAKVDTNSVSATRKNYSEVYVTYQGKEIALRQEYLIASKRAKQVYWPSQRKAPIANIASAFVALAHKASASNPTGMSMVSRLMMPVGFLADTFNFSLKWDEKRRSVEINTTK